MKKAPPIWRGFLKVDQKNYLRPLIGQVIFISAQSLGSHAPLVVPAAAGLVLVIFSIFFMLEQQESFVPAAAGIAFASVPHASDPQHASADALHELAVADVALALTLLVLLQPAIAKLMMVISVRVSSFFILYSPIGVNKRVL
tara:strand:- start:189 stop:617 length:429 start_codon:yes stop_codon:yes gene_type:complete